MFFGTVEITFWLQNTWDCGQMYTSSTTGNWETEDCFQKQAFMCEIQAGKDPVVPENTAGA